MKRLLFVVAAVLICLPFAAQCWGDSVYVSGLYNTGVDPTLGLLGNGALIPYSPTAPYTLQQFPGVSTTTLMVRTSAGSFPIPPWVGDDGLSAWIGPANDSSLDGPAGLYDYQTTFTISNTIPNPNMVRISGGVAGHGGGESADNQIYGILLNGTQVTPVNYSAYDPSGYTQFSKFYPFSITNGYRFGQNTLDFLVYNDAPSNNPTGLRVEMTSSNVSRGVIPTLFNTGVDQFGQPLPDLSLADSHYQLVSVPGATSQIMVRNGGGFPVGPWLGPDSLSAWIGPNDPGNQYPNDLNGPAGPYDYQTTFSLTGFDPSSVVISGGINGGWSTDNQGVAILLNGHQVWGPNDYDDGDLSGHVQFTQFFPFSIIGNSLPNGAYLNPGSNTLDFIVYNDPNPGGGDNPTGLRVEMTGTADYAWTAGSTAIIPEPLSMIFFGTGIVGVLGYVARRKMLRQA